MINTLNAKHTNAKSVYFTVSLYDESGMPIGMHYRTSGYSSGTWDAYWFERNLHGDVVAIYNNSNTKLASYIYDAWGNHTVTYHNGGGSLTAIVNNPIRYRGYYYDIDLGLYYIQSRYYDSNIGRFINADGVISGANGSLHGFNLYAYCFNNPVLLTDSSGGWPQWLLNVGAFISNNITAPSVAFVGSAERVVKNIIEDISNYDTGNKSEDVVFSANYFSSYYGVLVVRKPFEGSFSFGFIALSDVAWKNESKNMLKHEYGHTRQLENMGWGSYIVDVAIPSLTIALLRKMEKLPYDYYTYPWEAEANSLVKIEIKEKDKSPLPPGGYTSYWDLIPLFFK